MATKKSAKKSAKKSSKKSAGVKVSAKKPAAKKSTKKSSKKSTKKAAGLSPSGPLAAPGQPHFPGFDTGSYPGDTVMRKWFGNPYVFTGFYLESPCHKSPSFKPWQGHRQTLKDIGWGLVVVYVGRQAAGCGANSLSRQQGLDDAADAVSKAKGEGIPQGATVFLDVERMDTIPPKMFQYMRGWIAGVLTDKFYKAGVYAHVHNAENLMQAARQEYVAQGEPGGAPSFWIVRMPGGSAFNVLTSGPQDLKNFPSNPISFASVWQGKLDIASETHNGVTFGPVDQNVADSQNPSNA